MPGRASAREPPARWLVPASGSRRTRLLPGPRQDVSTLGSPESRGGVLSIRAGIDLELPDQFAQFGGHMRQLRGGLL